VFPWTLCTFVIRAGYWVIGHVVRRGQGPSQASKKIQTKHSGAQSMARYTWMVHGAREQGAILVFIMGSFIVAFVVD